MRGVPNRLKVEIWVPKKLSAILKFKKLQKTRIFAVVVKFARNSFGCKTLFEL